MSSHDRPVVEFDDISKSYGSIQALESVSLGIRENEVLALMGDNGAGKSTLIKILSGVLPPSGGEIRLNGETADFDDHIEAREAGIETVYQDLAIAPNRTVAENIFLGKEPLVDGPIGEFLRVVDDQLMRDESAEVLDRLGMSMDPSGEVKNLSGGQQQAVAVARAVQSDPDIIIMDEPTSALSVEAAQRILELIEDLKAEGRTVILIDHNIDEVFDVADRIAVLAHGRIMGTREAESLSEDRLIQMMMGVADPDPDGSAGASESA
jgi:ABC-type sugar transport system ATPase subunit